MAEIEWHEYDRTRKDETTPEADEAVWIVEADYAATIGYFDGFTFRLWTGTDDCHVSHWAPITYPTAPEPAVSHEEAAR